MIAEPDVNIEVKTTLFPTENEETVLQALGSLFPETTFSREGDLLVGTPLSLNSLRQKIIEQKIRDSARAHLEKSGMKFMLSKQAATVGKISFVEEPGGPLGEINVKITGDANIIQWLAQRTIEPQQEEKE